MANRSAEEIADAVAYVCEHVDSLRTTLTSGPADGPRRLDELLTALRDEADPADHLEAVHRALRRARDALGVFGRNRDAPMATLAGVERDRPHEPVLLCPRASRPCARFAWPGRGEAPVCVVTGAHLRRTTLAP
ncbi:hypothetical protein [Amycolatopsis pigmentata]|uniref:Uncharacterized protein n=1 Tax=Amycolatopsis pigmentata TaxID=450801 RepID=A0ABW5FKZ7_9PSEU